ncbi:M48 family metalloprotease [Acidovorax sp. Q11]
MIKRATQLRSAPGDTSSALADLAASAKVTRTAQRQGAWVQVRAESGAEGWIHMFDIGSPARDNAAAGALRAVSNPLGGVGSTAVSTSTVGIRGLGEGNVSQSVGASGRGATHSQGMGQADRLRVTANEARAFATAAALQPRRVDALPVSHFAAAAAEASNAASAAAPAAADTHSALGALLQSADGVTEAQEIELGRQMAALLLQGKPLDPAPEMQRYVNLLGRWVSLQSSRPQLPWTFVVVDESDFNAYSTPGGHVFLTRGLVDRCADEAELAGILAHEIAHVASRHHLRAMHSAARSGKVSPSLTALARHTHTLGLGAEAEHAADREAVVLAARAGLDPFGLVSALVQLNALGDSDLQFADAHPQSRLRLDQLERAMAQPFHPAAGAPAPVTIDERLASHAVK